MTVLELLQRCLASTQDHGAWNELWRVAESCCLQAFQGWPRHRGCSRHAALDLMQDLFFHLQENDWARLKRFRGTTEPQLRKFLYQMALHLARQTSSKERTARKREEEAIRAAGTPDRAGPTEEQIRNRYRELEARMPGQDRQKLQCVSPYAAGAKAALAPPSAAAPAISERTVQHWRTQLLGIYADWV